MTKDDVYNKIREILSERFEIESGEIKSESKLFEELGLDSIDAVDLIVELKPYLDGKIDSELFKQVRTVQDLTDIIYNLLKK
ncbi:MAG: phosphopantetheine-binding protein [Spirochaetaceae bacterium]|jgi:acyl carrier protein|nr:phosphopantetheine-binding protein [Spirochaetaceae bacterium]